MSIHSKAPAAARRRLDSREEGQPSWPLWYQRLFMTREEKDVMDRRVLRGLYPERLKEDGA